MLLMVECLSCRGVDERNNLFTNQSHKCLKGYEITNNPSVCISDCLVFRSILGGKKGGKNTRLCQSRSSQNFYLAQHGGWLQVKRVCDNHLYIDFKSQPQALWCYDHFVEIIFIFNFWWRRPSTYRMWPPKMSVMGVRTKSAWRVMEVLFLGPTCSHSSSLPSSSRLAGSSSIPRWDSGPLGVGASD